MPSKASHSARKSPHFVERGAIEDHDAVWLWPRTDVGHLRDGWCEIAILCITLACTHNASPKEVLVHQLVNVATFDPPVQHAVHRHDRDNSHFLSAYILHAAERTLTSIRPAHRPNARGVVLMSESSEEECVGVNSKEAHLVRLIREQKLLQSVHGFDCAPVRLAFVLAHRH